MSITATTGLGGNDSEKDKDGGREQLHLSGWLGKNNINGEVKVSKYGRVCEKGQNKWKPVIAKFHAEKRPDDVEANVFS